MSYILDYHDDASQEFSDAFDCYFAQSGEVATQFDDDVRKYERIIADNPEHYKEVDGIHKCVMTRYPYIIYYQVFNNRAQIVAVSHTRRKPGYWKSRI